MRIEEQPTTCTYVYTGRLSHLSAGLVPLPSAADHLDRRPSLLYRGRQRGALLLACVTLIGFVF